MEAAVASLGRDASELPVRTKELCATLKALNIPVPRKKEAHVPCDYMGGSTAVISNVLSSVHRGMDKVSTLLREHAAHASAGQQDERRLAQALVLDCAHCLKIFAAELALRHSSFGEAVMALRHLSQARFGQQNLVRDKIREADAAVLHFRDDMSHYLFLNEVKKTDEALLLLRSDDANESDLARADGILDELMAWLPAMNGMLVTVILQKTKMLTVRVAPEEDVADLKEALLQKYAVELAGVSTGHMRLFCKKKLLQDHVSIAASGVTEDAKVMLIVAKSDAVQAKRDGANVEHKSLRDAIKHECGEIMASAIKSDWKAPQRMLDHAEQYAMKLLEAARQHHVKWKLPWQHTEMDPEYEVLDNFVAWLQTRYIDGVEDEAMRDRRRMLNRFISKLPYKDPGALEDYRPPPGT